MFQEEKHLKIVIRGIDPNEDTGTIIEELQLDYPATKVHRMYLVMVELTNNEAGRAIYNMKTCMSLEVIVETLRRKNGSGQCQRFAHVADCCRLT